MTITSITPSQIEASEASVATVVGVDREDVDSTATPVSSRRRLTETAGDYEVTYHITTTDDDSDALLTTINETEDIDDQVANQIQSDTGATVTVTAEAATVAVVEEETTTTMDESSDDGMGSGYTGAIVSIIMVSIFFVSIPLVRGECGSAPKSYDVAGEIQRGANVGELREAVFRNLERL